MAEAPLANLVIVGIPKAGTSSLFAYLAQHPDICASDEKEIGYFNYFNPLRHAGEPPPVEDYARHFAHCTGERYILEATPTYSYGGQPVIDGLKRVLDRPKIIIALRDPADRLWSAYTFQRSLGNLTHVSSFADYLGECEARRRDGRVPVPGDHMHGLQIGFYGDYVGLWLDAFGDDLKVVFAEDLAREPSRVVGELCRWLGIDDDVSWMDLGARNVTRHPRSRRVAKFVFSVKRSADRMGLVPTRYRHPLRQVYHRVNAGELAERLDPSSRRRVEEIYRASNTATSAALAGHGYRDLPAWLRVDSHA